MKVYSLDNERYYELSDVEDMVSELDDKELSSITIYKADKKEYTHNDFINVGSMIDDMQDIAYDRADEYAETYLNDLSKSKRLELEKVICNWLDTNVERPNFFSVENVSKITIMDFINE